MYTLKVNFEGSEVTKQSEQYALQSRIAKKLESTDVNDSWIVNTVEYHVKHNYYMLTTDNPYSQYRNLSLVWEYDITNKELYLQSDSLKALQDICIVTNDKGYTKYYNESAVYPVVDYLFNSGIKLTLQQAFDYIVMVSKVIYRSL